MKRFGQVIRIKPEKADFYLDLHRNMWPEVRENMKQANIQNYTMFVKGDLAFQYFEYVGHDFKADIAKDADNEVTRKWEALCRPCHDPLDDREPGEWWAGMEEVVHCD